MSIGKIPQVIGGLNTKVDKLTNDIIREKTYSFLLEQTMKNLCGDERNDITCTHREAVDDLLKNPEKHISELLYEIRKINDKN